MKRILRDLYVRRECCDFIFSQVTYEIEGTLEEGGIIEWTGAVRIDPFTGTKTEIPFSRWPFTSDDEVAVATQLLER